MTDVADGSEEFHGFWPQSSPTVIRQLTELASMSKGMKSTGIEKEHLGGYLNKLTAFK